VLKPDLKIQLSRTISHALRHAPEVYGLVLDQTDSVALGDLVVALRKSAKEFADLDEFDIVELTLDAQKARHQIQSGRIRALYGHSMEQRRPLMAADAPSTLFHGTSPAALGGILEQGLQPMGRQFVHLSPDLETAITVGRRKASKPVVLEVQAHLAEKEGEKFFQITDKIWLAEKVVPKFVRVFEQRSQS
jgi:putative RNA 2'-phosphotransferase